GVTYMTFAPEHPLVAKITTAEQKKAVEAYVVETRKVSDIDRTSTEREKTGVFTGAYATNPVNGARVPIWISDYVLLSYGTGAVMAVPAHDDRDFEFAKKFDLKIIEVISPDGKPAEKPLETAYTNQGIMINSGEFDGTASVEGKEEVTAWLAKRDLGDATVNYRLRDWGISRQRFWGAPIPIVYCEKCGEVAVPEADLPVKLPYDVKFTGEGESPLTTNPDFFNTTCPKCGGPATREVDTMDTFVCSSWYYLRYPDSKNDKQPFDPEIINKWLPVDQYIGGAEHANMHLIYARFFTKVLYDMGMINFDEPFKRLTHQGMITRDGDKMSKSRGNVVNPDKYIVQYGSDTFRLYMMFMGSYADGGDWNDKGMHGVARFIGRFWRIVQQLNETQANGTAGKKAGELERVRHNSIKWATTDLERIHFNTPISRIMELVNACYQYIQQNDEALDPTVIEAAKITLIQLLAPFAPHMCEELWEEIGKTGSVVDNGWPSWDEQKLKLDEVNVVVQINGKVRAQLKVERDTEQAVVIEMAMADEKVQKHVADKEIIKQIFVKNKLLNLVVK
ncbi:leucine--tRNA ligase, partial [bacterium]|nr:leucine--tRNA ligase [bacterium]